MMPSTLISVDTETTGLDLRHGCKPFLVSTCTDAGRVKCWEWPVHPITRQPKIPHADKEAILKHLAYKTLVFHSAKFELRAFSTIGIQFTFIEDYWGTTAKKYKGCGIVTIPAITYHDTQLAAHACSSGDEYQRLKSLAVRHLRYSDADEQELKKAVAAAARYCKSEGIEIVRGANPTGKQETDYDYWLPKFVDSKSKVCLTYAGNDTERTILLWMMYLKLMSELNVWDGYGKERELLQTVYSMETGGVTINRSAVRKKQKNLSIKRNKHAKICTAFGSKQLGREINLGSYIDLQELLYAKLKLPEQTTVRKNKQGERKEVVTTEKKALAKLLELSSYENSPNKNPQAAEFLENLILTRAYEGGVRYLQSYEHYALDHPRFPGYAYLYPSLNQAGTGTSRFSSSNPNGQNVSKIVIIEVDGKPFLVDGRELEGPRLRDVFCPLPGKIWYAKDYNQLELRVFAVCSKEQHLIDALNAGYDFHGYVATRLFNTPIDKVTKQQRRIAKNTNFAIIFGGSPWKVDLTAGMTGAYEMFSGQFPNVHDFMQGMIQRARKDHYVRTLDGYRLDVPHSEPYKIVSYLVQGTAGRIIKNAMLEINRQKLVDWQHSRLALQIHDELISEFDKTHPSHTPSAVYKIMRVMEEAGEDMGVVTPVSCDRITTDWGHGEEVKVTRTKIAKVNKAAA